MNSFFKVVLATVPMALLLLWGINHFVLQTRDLPRSLDLKSSAYLRNTASSGSDSEKNAAKIAAADALLSQEKLAESEQSLAAQSDSELDPLATDAEPELKDSIEDAAVLAESEDESSDSDKDSTGTEAELAISDLKAREQAVLEKLGMSKAPPPPPTAAIDVAYSALAACEATAAALAPVTVKFRFDSPSIKGESLNVLETIVAEYRRCQGGSFQLSKNPLGKVDESPALTQRRLDELKYFFIQHSVPKTALEYPEEL